MYESLFTPQSGRTLVRLQRATPTGLKRVVPLLMRSAVLSCGHAVPDAISHRNDVDISAD
jgi:hypothetical protein